MRRSLDRVRAGVGRSQFAVCVALRAGAARWQESGGYAVAVGHRCGRSALYYTRLQVWHQHANLVFS